MPGGIGRGSRTNRRQRLEFQKLGALGAFDVEEPLVYDADEGVLSFDSSTIPTTTVADVTDELLVRDVSEADPKLRRITIAELIADVLQDAIGNTGDIKATFASAAPTGWLILNGDTIGDVGSGADHEDADLEDLFDMVKAFAPNTGAEDFASGDMVTLPNMKRRVLVGAGGTGTATLGNAIGDTGGEEEHTLTQAEMPIHVHSYNFPAAVVNRQAGASGNLSSTFSLFPDTGQAGGDDPHNNIQPSLVVNYLVRI